MFNNLLTSRFGRNFKQMFLPKDYSDPSILRCHYKVATNKIYMDTQYGSLALLFENYAHASLCRLFIDVR